MRAWIVNPPIRAGLVTLIIQHRAPDINRLCLLPFWLKSCRDRTRVTSLMLALPIRAGLLASLSWPVTLIPPLLTV